MSHVVESELIVSDLDALAVACEKVGLELRLGQTTHAWFGKFMNDWNDPQRAAAAKGRDPKTFGKCVHAIRSKTHQQGDYEIGLVERADGKGYDAVYDQWGPGGKLERLAGKDLDALAQEYATEVTVRKLKRQRFNVVTTLDAQGRTRISATRG